MSLSCHFLPLCLHHDCSLMVFFCLFQAASDPFRMIGVYISSFIYKHTYVHMHIGVYIYILHIYTRFTEKLLRHTTSDGCEKAWVDLQLEPRPLKKWAVLIFRCRFHPPN